MTPKSAMNAGSSIACDMAAENGACRKPGSCATAPSDAPPPPAPPGISADSRAARNAAIPALPSTEPTWRVVL